MKTRDYQGHTFPAHFDDQICSDRLMAHYQKLGEWPDLRGEVVGYEFDPAEGDDPSYVVLEYADGRRIRVDGGGDYCASASVSFKLLKAGARA